MTMARGDAPWWRPPGTIACAVAALLLALVIGAPVLRAPTERLFGDESVGRAHDPYTVAAQFADPPESDAYLQPLTDLPGRWLARALGGVAALNLILILSFPLAAWGAYLLIARLGASRAGSAFGALAFAFSPFHLAHAAYHPHVAQVQWLAFVFLALAAALESSGAAPRIGLAGALLGAGLASFYLGWIAAITVPAFVLGAAWSVRRGEAPGTARAVRSLALTLGGLAAAIGVAVLLLRPEVVRDPAAFSFPEADLERYTARPAAYLLPAIEHPLLGSTVSAWWESAGLHQARLEQQLTIGVGLLVLAAAGARRLLRSAAPARRAVGSGLVAAAIVAVLVSLPPRFEVAGVGWPMPSALLFEIAPMFRALARFGAVAGLAAAVLGGVGLSALWAAGRRGPRALAVASGLLALFELAPLPPLRGRDVLPTSAHRWLAGWPDPGVTLDCAYESDPAARSVRDFYPHEIVLLEEGEDCLEPGLASRRIGDQVVRVLLRHDDPVAVWLDRHGAPESWTLLRRFPDAVIYRLDVLRPAPLYVRRGSGFFALELGPEGPYRWMGERGELRLTNRSKSDLVGRLTLTARAFPAERRFEILRLGEAWTTIRVGPERTLVELPALRLAPGETRLELRALEAAAIPDDLLGNGDRRAVTVALEEWALELAATASAEEPTAPRNREPGQPAPPISEPLAGAR